jgi:iron(III) transport system permease protein
MRLRRMPRLSSVPVAPAAGVVALVALVAYLALVPLGYLISEAFFVDGRVSLEHFRDAYARTGLASVAGASILFAAGSSALALVTGTALAFLVVRTDLPFRRTVFALALLPLIVPGILYTIAWILLASPRIGPLAHVLPWDFEIFGMGGMILVEGLHGSPIVFLLMAAAFRSLDPALEEAALTSGARRVTVLRRVTLPLVRPAVLAALLLMVVRALESFEVPALIGLPGGTDVFTSRIWRAVDDFPVDMGAAAAYSVPLLAVTALGVLLYAGAARRGSRFETVTGRGVAPTRIALGAWRGPVAVAVGGYLVVAALAPLAVLGYASTQRFYSKPSVDGLSRLTADNYASLVDHPATVHAFTNSLLLSVATATGVMLLMSVVAWLVVRGRLPGRWLLDGMASMPLAIPGLVLGVALLSVYVRSPLPVYGTLWLLLIAYFTRFMPYGMRYASSAMQQLGTELEEAARTSGARWTQTFRRVTLPLLLPGLVAGWLFVVIVTMRELSAAILLYPTGEAVLPVRIFELYDDGKLTELAALGVVMTVVLTLLAALAWSLAGRFGARAR